MADDTLEAGDEFPGRFGFGLWLSPYRFMNDPTAFGGGLGVEFLWSAHRNFGLTFSAGVGYLAPDTNRETGKWALQSSGGSDQAASLELEAGARYLPLHWRTGSLHIGTRMNLWIVDGMGPVEATTSLGGELRLGVELGKRWRASIESAFGYRVALNQSDAGWLEVGYMNGAGGMYVEIVRVGVRFYV